MTYRGHVENGVVVLDEPAELPEGAVVEVDLPRPLPKKPAQAVHLKYAGSIEGLPPDYSLNYRQYRASANE
ncbi:MAG: hypothetical protein GHCLOJNM_01798 [bacterium]|nr:hypothetical protein [bacterium]